MKKLAMTSTLLVALAALALGRGTESAPQNQAPGSANEITAGRLRAHLEYIANGLLEGRDTPSRGLNLAALYIQTQLKLWGVQPGGDDGGYYHKFILSRESVDAQHSAVSIGGTNLVYGKEFYCRGDSSQFSGPVVFVGHGYKLPAKNINPYKGIDVKGKILLTLAGQPKDVTFRDLRRSPGVVSPTDMVKKYGAKGIIVLHAEDSDVSARAATTPRGGGYQLRVDGDTGPVGTVGIGPSALAKLLVQTPQKVNSLLQMVKSQDEGISGDLPTAGFAAQISTIGDKENCQNVVGIVRGSDPALRDEYVVYGAHYDHLGVAPDGKIYYGADDDGSGTTALLELAHAYAVGKAPRRSIMFVWHAGEEKGLWGSQAFTTRPTVPLTSIVTQINIDMIGRSKKAGDTNSANANLTGPHATFAVGPFFASPELGNILDDVNSKYENIEINTSLDNYQDPERIFFRSDHYNYASKGIPIVFFFDGVHEDYHKTTDTVEKIDFVKHQDVTRLAYALGLHLANMDGRVKFVDNMKAPGS